MVGTFSARADAEIRVEQTHIWFSSTGKNELAIQVHAGLSYLFRTGRGCVGGEWPWGHVGILQS